MEVGVADCCVGLLVCFGQGRLRWRDAPNQNVDAGLGQVVMGLGWIQGGMIDPIYYYVARDVKGIDDGMVPA